MKRFVFITGMLMVLSIRMGAQDYKITTDREDPFSVKLVELLTCAANRFEDCRGSLIRRTSLMGDDYELTFPFPGSIKAIVRFRDWEKNAYVEFRDSSKNKTQRERVKDLVVKIRHALGDQLYDRYENQGDKEFYFYSLSIKDKNGFFSANMEILSGTSSEEIYLLGPEREDHQVPGKEFLLLKIYGGIPNYQHYISPVTAPDQKLNQVLHQFLLAAETDFAGLPVNRRESLNGVRKGLDTIQREGFPVFMSYRGSHYSANFRFAATTDTMAYQTQWFYYQKVLESALGEEYVYRPFSLQERPYVVYYKKNYTAGKPVIYLEMERDINNQIVITVRIQSSFSHPTKRGMSWDD